MTTFFNTGAHLQWQMHYLLCTLSQAALKQYAKQLDVHVYPVSLIDVTIEDGGKSCHIYLTASPNM